MQAPPPRAAPALAPERRWVLSLLLAFALSRLLVFHLGVRFSADTVARLWQVLDPRLLAEDLARSLLYCHAQPPLFNLYVGLGQKLAGPAAGGLFHVVQMAASAAATVAIFRAARALGAARPLAAVAALIFAVSPGTIGFENYLFYPILEAGLLAGAAPLLHGYLARRDGARGGAAFAALAALVLLRSYFHLGWLLLGVGLVVALRPEARRRTLGLAAVPLLVAFLWYAKNYVVFGSFTSSTWLGMSLSRITLQTLDNAERKQLSRDGVISVVGRLDSFGPLTRYEGYVEMPEATGIPALDQRRKRYGYGGSNYNHLAYIEISRVYLRDALALVHKRPAVYWVGIQRALEHYFRPVSRLRDIESLLEPLSPYPALAERILFGTVVREGHPTGHCLAIVAGLPLLLAYGSVAAVREARRTAPDRARIGLLAFLVLNVSYVTVVGNLLELGENNRFRFTVEPLLAVLLAFAAHGTLQRARRGWRRRARGLSSALPAACR